MEYPAAAPYLPAQPSREVVYLGSRAAIAAFRAGDEVVTTRDYLDDGTPAVRLRLLEELYPYQRGYAPQPRVAQTRFAEYRPYPSSPDYGKSAKPSRLTPGQKWVLVSGAAVAFGLAGAALLIWIFSVIGAILAGSGALLIGCAAIALLVICALRSGGGGGGGALLSGGINFIGNTIGKVTIRR